MKSTARRIWLGLGDVKWEALYRLSAGHPAVNRHAAVRAAVQWLCNAQDAAGCGGFSRAYALANGWGPPYPETTGYIIPTLLSWEKELPDLKLEARARYAGAWLSHVQLTCGATCSLMYHPENKQPSVFNTGMVLHGWVSLMTQRPDADLADSAARAVQWLVAQQEEDGTWRKNAYNGIPHSYYTMVDWALLRYFNLTGEHAARLAAVRHLDWTLGQQRTNGWINGCFFQTGDNSLTHLLSYATQGLVECAKALGESRYLEAARHATVPLLDHYKRHGHLAGEFDPSWRPTVAWECVVGNSQTAIVWFELARCLQDQSWNEWGQELRTRSLQCQRLGTRIAGIDGALPGSWPIHGSYNAFAFPNHAAKFFADSWLY